MATALSKISTIVRNITHLGFLRLSFRIGSRLRPEATLRRGARLFCTPLTSSRQRARLAPTEGAQEQSVEVGGLPITTYAWGDPRQQPYVLFAHGWSSHGTRIRAWIAALRAAGYAVVAFDQVAHGKSGGREATLPAFTDLLLGIGRKFGPAAGLIGHSLGGAAAALALHRGLQAKRAILIAPAADPVDAGYRFARFVGMAEYLCQRMFDLFAARLGISFEDQQAQRFAPAIGRPALIVHDLEDRDVPWSEGERYARYWPDSRLLTTRGLGHNRIVDDPTVIAAGLAFLHGKPVGERVVSSPNLPYGVA